MPRQFNLSGSEKAQIERFDSHYEVGQSPVMIAVERCVCGCNYGADSWTTQTEADQMIARLALHEGTRLLDLGAGSGWPGLYLARTSHCDVMLADVSPNGLRIAAERAESDGIAQNVRTAVADAADLPFKDGSFDAITHSDLLCCLEQKRSVLSECRRVIRPRGRMLFTVISVRPGLSSQDTGRAVANGPTFIETDTDYPELLAETGWIVSGREDISGEFAATCRRQLQADDTHREELAALLGETEFTDRVAGWPPKISAIDGNLIRRELFFATPG